MQNFLYFLWFLFVFSPAFSQTVAGEKSLRTEDDEKEKLQKLLSLGKAFLRGEPDKTLRYGSEALSLSYKLMDFQGEYTALLMVRDAYLRMRNDDKALLYEVELAAYYERNNRPQDLMKSLKSIGDAYMNHGVYETALQYYLKLLEEKERGNDIKGSIDVIDDIGMVFRKQRNYEEALEYFGKAMRHIRSTEVTEESANTSNLIGGTYYLMGRYDSAYLYFNRAYQIRLKIGDKIQIAKSINNLGLIYNKNKQPEKALKNFNEALETLKAVADTSALSSIMDNIGDAHLESGNLSSALSYHSVGLTLAERANIKEKILESYHSLVETYLAMKNFQRAYEYEHRYRLITDSLYTEKSARQIAEMHARYDNVQKQGEIELLLQQRENQELVVENQQLVIANQQRNYYMAVVALLALGLLAGLAYRSSRQSKKQNSILTAQNVEINQQKEEIQRQRDSVGKKSTELTLALSEIDKKNRDVMSSINYARRIQNAFLPKKTDLVQILPDSFLFFRPKGVVSGDFYWFMEVNKTPINVWKDTEFNPPTTTLSMIPDEWKNIDPIAKTTASGKVIIAAVDCTGHGVPGAFMSLVGSSLLREIVSTQHVHSPEHILSELDKGIRTALRQEETNNRDGMDIALCVIDQETQRLEFAGAKNPLLIVTADGQIRFIKGDRQTIGGENAQERKQFTCHTINYKKGDTFYIYTDGFQDQFGGEDGRKLMSRQFKDLLVSMNQLPMEAQKHLVEKEFVEWKGKHQQQTDDILVIGFRL